MMERQVKGIKQAKVNTKVPYKGCAPTTTQQTKKVKARATAGVGRLQVMEQLGMSKASDYSYLSSI